MDLADFQRTLRAQWAATPAQITADLDELRLFDRGQEALARRWLRWTITGFVSAFVSIFIVLPLGASLPPDFPAPILAVLPIGLAVLAIVAAVRWRRAARFNLPDERYQLLAGLCALLGADLPDGGTLETSLDFGPFERPELLQGETKRGRWTCKLYLQPWLRARGRLVDGTRFDIRASQRAEIRTCWARSRSGKTKRKRKVKGLTVLDVSLSPKGDRAGDLGGAGPALQAAVKLPTEARPMRVRATADSVELRAAVTPQLHVSPPLDHTVAMMLLSLYQVLGGAQDARRRGAT